jgi:hypothetical protein
MIHLLYQLYLMNGNIRSHWSNKELSGESNYSFSCALLFASFYVHLMLVSLLHLNPLVLGVLSCNGYCFRLARMQNDGRSLL